MHQSGSSENPGLTIVKHQKGECFAVLEGDFVVKSVKIGQMQLMVTSTSTLISIKGKSPVSIHRKHFEEQH